MSSANPERGKFSQGVPRIGVFGHFGNQNLGDESIVAATLQNIRKRFPFAEILGMSLNPDDTAFRHGISTLSIRRLNRSQPVAVSQTNAPSIGRIAAVGNPVSGSIKSMVKAIPFLWDFLSRLYRVLASFQSLPKELAFLWDGYRGIKGIDLLFVAGSNQFLDNFGGAMGFPYTLLKWTVLAKIAGAKVAFVSIGAGPLNGTTSKLFIRLALTLADYISYRDSASKAMVESPPFPFIGAVFPDLANSLDFNVPNPMGAEAGAKPTVAINPMPVHDARYWYAHDDVKYKAFVEKLAGFANFLFKENYPFFFFPTQSKDELVIADVIDLLDPALREKHLSSSLVRSCKQVEELMRVIGSADIVVPTRFHGVLLSLLAGKPTIGVCYYRKTADLLRDKAQGDFQVDIDRFEVTDLIDKLKTLTNNLSGAAEVIALKNQEYRAALERQYDLVFKLLPNRIANDQP